MTQADLACQLRVCLSSSILVTPQGKVHSEVVLNKRPFASTNNYPCPTRYKATDPSITARHQAPGTCRRTIVLTTYLLKLVYPPTSPGRTDASWMLSDVPAVVGSGNSTPSVLRNSQAACSEMSVAGSSPKGVQAVLYKCTGGLYT